MPTRRPTQFPRQEIPHVLEALRRCLKRVQKDAADDHEVRLSRRLRIALLRDRRLRDRPIEVFREQTLDDLATGQESRIDLHFMFSTGRNHPWPYFAVEAKRLHVAFKDGWKSLVSEYVSGYQGMMCFVNGRYSKGLNSGCMLGYVFDGDIARAEKLISDDIAKNYKLLKMARRKGLVSSVWIGGAWETKHRIGRRPFVMFHLLAAV